MFMKSLKTQVAVVMLLVMLEVPLGLGAGHAVQEGYLAFKDVSSQTKEFIAYYHSIALTPAQNKVKERALRTIPAPCCKDYSILTCCCPCNFAKSVWGLSNYLIAKRGYNETQLRKAVVDWVNFTHSNGSAGDACYKGRCNLPFAADGCGGMDERQPVF